MKNTSAKPYVTCPVVRDALREIYILNSMLHLYITEDSM